MTIASEINRSGPYFGNGVTTAFDYKFRVVDASYIKVISAENGVETILELDADYSVTGVGSEIGGQVIFNVAPAAGVTILFLLGVPFIQDIDLENQGAYNAETVEDGFDLAAQRDLQLSERIDRAVVIPATADPGNLEKLTTDVLRLADSADNVDAVANSLGNIAAVVAIGDDVSTVAGIAAEVPLIPGYVSAAQQAATDAAASALSVNAENLLQRSNNFSDVADKATAMDNLGAANKAGDTFTGSVTFSAGLVSTSYKSNVSTGWLHAFKAADDTDCALIEGAGNFYAKGEVTAYWSDARLKTNVVSVSSHEGLNRVLGYRVVDFSWNEKGQGCTGKSADYRERGLIAQEAQKVNAQAVTEQALAAAEDGTKYLTLREKSIIFDLIGAVQALQAEIDLLKRSA